MIALIGVHVMHLYQFAHVILVGLELTALKKIVLVSAEDPSALVQYQHINV